MNRPAGAPGLDSLSNEQTVGKCPLVRSLCRRVAGLAQFRTYALGARLRRDVRRPGRCRAPHYAALFERLQVGRSARSCASASRRPTSPSCTRASPSPSTAQNEGTERIFPYDLIPRIITADGMGRARARPDPAHHRAQPVPEGHLPRRAHPGRRRRAARAGLQLQALPPRDAGRARAPRRLRVGGRHRPGAPARRHASPCSKTTCACRAA